MTTKNAMQETQDCGETFDLDSFTLLSGGHGSTFRGECCVLELANRAATCVPLYRKKYGAPEKFEAGHPTISPAIAAFCMSWNDSIRDDATRTRLLRPYATKILGTKTTAKDEETRAWMATDWLVRVQAPAWLDLAGLTDRAKELRGLKPLTSAKIAIAVQSVLDKARTDASAAGAAAGAAAWDAAWDAAWAAARAAAWDAAWAAAGAAAWDAAGAAAWAAARDAAGAAARAAAWAAAWDAAAGARLAPTVTELQASACDLLDRMIAVGKKRKPAKRGR